MSDFDDALLEVRQDLLDRDAVRRLYEGDHTLWRDDPTELADRLGWIPVIEEVQADLPDLIKRCDALVEGIEHVLVMGMGGSSLFPEVLARSLSPGPGRPRLHVLDTTDPAAITRFGLECDPATTLHLASSKSGSTIETRSHLEWAWSRAEGRGRFAVITDPGSELAELARTRDFADVFENRPDIGGRYSALSLFGVVPGLLMGADMAALLAGGLDALAHSAPDVDPEQNPALQLATAIGAGVRVGRDKVTYLLDPALTAMGLWVEQLVAESLGKDGTGAVPIVGEPLGAPGVYGDDRLFLSQLPIPELEAAGHPAIVGGSDSSAHGIGHMAVTMEVAVALAGAAIGVQPFDQPDVAAAKAATAEVLAEGGAEIPEQSLGDLLGQLRTGDHLALQAFIDPADPRVARLEAARVALRDRHRVATSLGLGPRFLHSTGQLHKGGPPAIVCVQVAADDQHELEIPGQPFGFGHLKQAQAAGDLRTLQARGIRAGRVAVSDLLGAGS
jgi:transaldolase / glucose-6-phosphate isomerase